MVVDGVRHCGISEREGVSVLTQGGRSIRMPEPRLCLEDLASRDEERRDVMPQSMQRRAIGVGSASEAGESVDPELRW